MVSFSIITSTLNSSKHIKKCICSVEAQTYRNYEHLIVDGGSTDGTLELIKKSTNPNLTLVCTEPDNGIYQAWNKGLEASKGDWIITLGSDDYFVSEYDLEIVAEFIDKQVESVNAKFLYAETTDDKELETIRRNYNFYPLYRGVTAYPTAVFISRKLINSGSRFDESYKICGDHKFFEINRFWESCVYIPRKIYHFSPGGISTNKKNKYINYLERSRMLSELGRKRPLIFELYYYLRSKL